MSTSTIVGTAAGLRRAGASAVVLMLLVCLAPTAAAARDLPSGTQSAAAGPAADDTPDTPRWTWPTSSHRVTSAYVAPAHRYGPGHRGIDLSASPGAVVRAPADGVVAFVGTVAGRPLVTIDHGGGLVSTLEPVASDATPGDVVRKADPVGSVSVGGHVVAGSVHFGVRRDGEYLNPMLLLGGIRRAVLLPCCE
ncbi:MAG TPA: M23 family metallopeptidase [Microbacterium sp.]|nr:M23 family metallopeptidase [Microbacterium sp.]